MAKQLFANNVSTQIMEFLSATDTTITVSSTSRFPAISGGDWIMATIVPQGGQGTPEVVKITAFSGNDLTVIRAQEGTSAQSFLYGSLLEFRVTKGSLEFLRDRGGIVNVKTDFGAVGDGVTDDTAAIQSAINAVGSNTKIRFPQGTYLIGSGGILISGKTGIVLEGENSTIKIGAIASQTILAFGSVSIFITGSTSCGIRSLRIDGNSIASNAIGISASTDCFVSQCEIFSSGVNGQIVSGGNTRLRVTDSLVYSSRTNSKGVWLGNLTAAEIETDLEVSGNVVRNNDGTGIVFTSVGGRVENNHSKTNEGSGIIFSGGNGYSAKNISCVGNYCVDNFFHGIQSDVVYTTDADLSANITVSGNVCSGNNRGSGSGIYAVNCQRWTITGNICNDNTTAGIQADDRCYNVTISGNSCSETRTGASRSQLAGIRCIAQSQPSYGLALSGNICVNNKENGIAIQTTSPQTSSNISIFSNICRDNSIRGIFVAEAAVGEITKMVVAGNTCSGNTTVDLRLSLRDVTIGDNSYTTQDNVQYYDITGATPTVSGRTSWRLNNGGATTITNFVGGIPGQTIILRGANANTTIQHGGSIVNKGAANAAVPGDGSIAYMLQDTVWREIYRSF